MTMGGSTDSESNTTEKSVPPSTPKRKTRSRSRTKQGHGSTKSDMKTPARRSRERPKSLGPGTMGRRAKYDKFPLSASPETRRTAGPRQTFRMTENNLAVPGWGKTETAATIDTGGVKGMDMDRGEDENREVKIKREQIEEGARKTKKTNDEAEIPKVEHSEVELIGVKSPEDARQGAEVIEIEDTQSQGLETDTGAGDEVTETMGKRIYTGGRGGGGEQLKVRTGKGEGGATKATQRIENPYKKRDMEAEATEPEETTPKGQANKTKETWAKAVKGSPQTVLKTYEKIKRKHELLGEVSFTVGRNCDDIIPAIEASIFREVIIHALKRGKEVDQKFVINAYHDDTNLPTIKKVEDVPFGLLAIRAYMPHLQVPPRKIKKGKNTGYRLRMSFSIQPDEFIHYWEMSKRTYTKVPYLTLRKTPMQDSPTYNTAGFFVNSSEKQSSQQLQEALSELLKTPIGIQFRPAAVDRHSQDTLWQAAKRESKTPREVYIRAPMALQVYAKSKAQARQVASDLYERYGKQEDGHYPRLPDGSRMRFVPASHFLDMKSRPMALRLLRQQINFAKNTIAAPIPVRDPNQRFPEYDNKTMQELLLDMKCAEREDEPYFRHVVKKWTREYDPQAFEVEIHNNMYGAAVKILRNLPEVMEEKYGKSAADALKNMNQDEFTEISQELSVITLETEDRYMNGKAQFIFTGLDTLREPDPPKSDQEEERSMNVKSTTSGLTGHQTVGSDETNPDSVVMEVDKHLGTTEAQEMKGFTEEGWKRIGTEEDKERLEKRMTEATTFDPGKTTGGQYP